MVLEFDVFLEFNPLDKGLSLRFVNHEISDNGKFYYAVFKDCDLKSVTEKYAETPVAEYYFENMKWDLIKAIEYRSLSLGFSDYKQYLESMYMRYLME